MKSFRIIIFLLLFSLIFLSNGCGNNTENVDNITASTSVNKSNTSRYKKDNIKIIKYEGKDPILKYFDVVYSNCKLEFKVKYDEPLKKTDFKYEVSDKKIFDVKSIDIENHAFADDTVSVKITGYNIGKAYFLLKSADNRVRSKKIKIRVRKVQNIDIKGKSKRKIKLNKEYKLTTFAYPEKINKSELSIKSSNKSIVKIKKVKFRNEFISTKIFITVVGVKPGKATVTVKSNKDVIKDKIKFTVYKPKHPVKLKSNDVYITRSGIKYHSYGCKFLKKSRKVTLAYAKSIHLEPCKICKPPK